MLKVVTNNMYFSNDFSFNVYKSVANSKKQTLSMAQDRGIPEYKSFDNIEDFSIKSF